MSDTNALEQAEDSLLRRIAELEAELAALRAECSAYRSANYCLTEDIRGLRRQLSKEAR